MRLLSHFAMAAALATAGTLAVTAFSQDAQAAKKKKEKEPKYNISKEVRPKVAAVQTAMASENPASAKPLITALLAEPLEGDDRYVAGQLAIQLGGQLQEPALQELGINASLESGRTPAGQLPAFTFFSGNFAYSAGRFDEAREKLEKAYALGYRENNISPLIAEAYFKNNELQRGLQMLDRAIVDEVAAKGVAPEDWYLRGAGVAMRANVPSLAATWTYKLVEAYPSGKNWRAAVTVYRDSAKLDDQQNLELMRLMRKANAMESERDYFEYADAAGPRKLPGEVASVLAEGIAAGAVRADTAYTKDTLGLARGSISADKAGLPSSARDAARSANGRIALATGDAYFGYGEYAKATEMYDLAISKGGIDNARAEMGRGIAFAGQRNWDQAKQAFASVTGPRKSVAEFWTLWINQQTQPAATPEVAAAAPAG